jgi:hypothetical protein
MLIIFTLGRNTCVANTVIDKAIQDGETTSQSNYMYIHVARLPLLCCLKMQTIVGNKPLQFVVHTNQIETEVSYSGTYLPNDVNTV